MQVQVLIFSLCVAVISCAPQEMSPDQMQHIMGCMQEHGVTMGEVQSFSESNPSDKQLCMGACVAMKLGFPKDMGKMFDKLAEGLNEEQQGTLRKCYEGITSTDACTVGKEMAACEEEAKKSS